MNKKFQKITAAMEKLKSERETIEEKLPENQKALEAANAELEAFAQKIGDALLQGKTTSDLEGERADLVLRVYNLKALCPAMERRLGEIDTELEALNAEKSDFIAKAGVKVAERLKAEYDEHAGRMAEIHRDLIALAAIFFDADRVTVFRQAMGPGLDFMRDSVYVESLSGFDRRRHLEQRNRRANPGTDRIERVFKEIIK